MRGTAICVLFAAGILALAQQTPTPSATDSEKKLAGISGIVVSLTGSPLPEATVILTRSSGQTAAGGWPGSLPIPNPGQITARGRTAPLRATSAADGSFSFPDLEPGEYAMQAEHADHLPLSYGAKDQWSSPEILTLTAGRKMDKLVLKMLSPSTISGKVVDGDGDPIAHYRVRVERLSYYDGIRRVGPVVHAVTDDNGEYRISNVPPGRFYLRASFLPTWNVNERAPVRSLKPGEKDLRWNDTFYPSHPAAEDIRGAVPLDVGVGQEITGITIKMRQLLFVHVRGKVIGANRPLDDARVLRLPREPGSSLPWSSGATIQPDGTFDLADIWPGAFTLAVFSRNGTYGWTPIQIVNKDLENVIIHAAVTNIPGSISFEGETKPSSAPAMRVLLIATEGPSVVFKDGVVREGRSFTIADVCRGKYRAEVMGLPEDSYLKSVRLAGREVLGEGLDLSGGIPEGELEIVINSDAGSVEGVVKQEKDRPAPGSIVTLVPEQPRFKESRLYPTTIADGSGRFRIAGVTPGSYKVFAWEEIENTAHWDPEFIRFFAAQGERITVEEKKTATPELTRISAAAMRDTLMRAGW